MYQVALTSVILALISSASSLPSEQGQLYKRSFNTFSPGFGGFNGFDSFGFPIIIKNNKFNANADKFRLNEFDRNTKAAVFADNVHKKNIDKKQINVNKANNLAVI